IRKSPDKQRRGAGPAGISDSIEESREEALAPRSLRLREAQHSGVIEELKGEDCTTPRALQVPHSSSEATAGSGKGAAVAGAGAEAGDGSQSAVLKALTGLKVLRRYPTGTPSAPADFSDGSSQADFFKADFSEADFSAADFFEADNDEIRGMSRFSGEGAQVY
ncbi:hypothetical protein B484DRAFT_408940, partial [Ochromonadaceae sp. CCMP2298]